MAELGAHQMDVAYWALKTKPRRVLASGGLDYWRDGRQVFDNVYCIYEYEMTPETGEPYTVRATYSSIQSNAYEGASELIMGTKGTLLLTEGAGLFYQEAGAEKIAWNKDEQAGQEAKAEQDASVITSGKTLNLSNNPWAHRGKPYEISSDSNSTRDQLISFLDCVQRRDTKTICDVETGMINSATILIANQAIKEGRTIEFPADV
jgi:hypothetical protein